MPKNWTEHHYKQYDEHVWVTWDEAGQPMSVHTTEKEAQETLMKYAECLEAEHWVAEII